MALPMMDDTYWSCLSGHVDTAGATVSAQGAALSILVFTSPTRKPTAGPVTRRREGPLVPFLPPPPGKGQDAVGRRQAPLSRCFPSSGAPVCHHTILKTEWGGA